MRDGEKENKGRGGEKEKNEGWRTRERKGRVE